MTSTLASRIPLALSTLALAWTIGAAAPAAAQQMYPGQDVSVNPAAGGGPRTLLTPDGRHTRRLPQLLEPGQPNPYAPIHLHMPSKHHRRAASESVTPKNTVTKVEQSEPASREASVAPEPAAAPRPAPPHRAPKPPPSRTAATETPAPEQPTAIPFSFGGEGPVHPAPPHKPAAKPAARAVAPPAPKPASTSVASAKPLPATTTEPGETRQAAILFDQDSTTLSNSGNAKLKNMASRLMTALTGGAEQVELVAYGGSPGDKSSSARRISLKRALAVREALIVYGVPASRIDVRALGGVEDNGPTDRVDIFVKS